MLKITVVAGALTSIGAAALRVMAADATPAHDVALPLVVASAAVAAAAALAVAVRSRRTELVLTASTAVIALAVAVGYHVWSVRSGTSVADIGGVLVVLLGYAAALALSLLTALLAPSPSPSTPSTVGTAPTTTAPGRFPATTVWWAALTAGLSATAWFAWLSWADDRPQLAAWQVACVLTTLLAAVVVGVVRVGPVAAAALVTVPFAALGASSLVGSDPLGLIGAVVWVGLAVLTVSVMTAAVAGLRAVVLGRRTTASGDATPDAAQDHPGDDPVITGRCG